MPFKNGDPDTRPVSGLRKIPSAGMMVHASNKQNMSMLIPAHSRPFFSSAETFSICVSSTEASSASMIVILNYSEALTSSNNQIIKPTAQFITNANDNHENHNC